MSETQAPVGPASTGRSDPLPAWPVLAMLWGFPVMWALGVTVVPGAVLMTGVMAAVMVVRRYAVWAPGVGALLAFAAWVLPCVVMIDSGERLLGFAYRYVIIAFVVTAFLYTLAARTRLTRDRVVHALTFVWVFSIVGGVLGLLLPEVRLTTPVGALLPDAIAQNSYVKDLFFPPFAEIQQPWGAPEPFIRPSAPYPYANSWGVAILLLTPVALACFFLVRTLWVRATIVVAAVVMIAPAMATTNRAMFAGIALAGVYVVARLAARDRAAPVLSLGALGIVAAGIMLWQGLLDSIAARQEYGSGETRLTLYEETIRRTLESPLLGFGAPRPSFEQDISVGTQGHVWTLMFSYGFVGLGLFLLFLWGTTLRTARCRDDADVALHSTLVVASLVVVIYGLDVMQLLTVFLVAAVLLRRRYGIDADAATLPAARAEGSGDADRLTSPAAPPAV